MRDIENRLRKLESKLKPSERPPVRMAAVMHALPGKRKRNLAAGERIVVDWYRDFGGVIEGRERISTDLADRGRVCKRGSYLLDVIRELHQTCAHRERTGCCRVCQGTPMAETAHLPCQGSDGRTGGEAK
jgi:hypothetical protein